jgi:small subunit ribosomal protein S23e
MGKNKPSGLNAARKLRNHRREGRWADLHYKKRLLGTAYKSSPFGGSSHAKGIVLEKVGVVRQLQLNPHIAIVLTKR